MNSSHGSPAVMVMRSCGIHHVETSTAPRLAKPSNELHGPRGAKRRGGRGHFAVRLRNARCVTKIISHTKIPPKNADPHMYTYAEALYRRSKNSAATMPTLETSSATTGAPRLLKRPSTGGAYPPRASENNIRAVRYKLQLTLESAAVSPTKFMIPAAAGIPADSKTRTNGLSPSPTWFQGTTPTTTASPPI